MHRKGASEDEPRNWLNDDDSFAHEAHKRNEIKIISTENTFEKLL